MPYIPNTILSGSTTVISDAQLRQADGRILTAASPEFGISGLLRAAQPGSGSAAWFSANDPAAFSFVLNEAATVEQLGWFNGSAPGENVDVGIYDTSFSQLISTGSTLSTGASAWQWVDVSDTPLTAGRYYLAMVADNVTANRYQHFASMGTGSMAFGGVLDSATDAFPLPDPLTNMASAATIVQVPVFAIMTRSPFV